MTVKALLVALVALQLSGTLAVSPAQPSLETQSQQEGLFALNDDCLQCIETKQSVNQRSAACDACAIAVGAQVRAPRPLLLPLWPLQRGARAL